MRLMNWRRKQNTSQPDGGEGLRPEAAIEVLDANTQALRDSTEKLRTIHEKLQQKAAQVEADKIKAEKEFRGGMLHALVELHQYGYKPLADSCFDDLRERMRLACSTTCQEGDSITIRGCHFNERELSYLLRLVYADVEGYSIFCNSQVPSLLDRAQEISQQCHAGAQTFSRAQMLAMMELFVVMRQLLAENLEIHDAEPEPEAESVAAPTAAAADEAHSPGPNGPVAQVLRRAIEKASQRMQDEFLNGFARKSASCANGHCGVSQTGNSKTGNYEQDIKARSGLSPSAESREARRDQVREILQKMFTSCDRARFLPANHEFFAGMLDHYTIGNPLLSTTGLYFTRDELAYLLTLLADDQDRVTPKQANPVRDNRACDQAQPSVA